MNGARGRVARRRQATRGFRLARANGEDQVLPVRIERAADFRRHLDVTLDATAGNQGGIKPTEDFLKWKRDQNTVAVTLW
jgi:hypothetical protein